MVDNILREDLEAVSDFILGYPTPKLTNGPKVEEFEKEWSKWLGVQYSVMVSSGAAANFLTMMAYRYLKLGSYTDETLNIAVPPLTWVSDISAVYHNRLNMEFFDINLMNLSFDMDQLKKTERGDIDAIFVTHVLGLNALTDELLDFCYDRKIDIIEDVCESHGATFKGEKCGSIGFASNFSFYFAHHMSTIEGGMVCTNDSNFYQILRALRSHGMTREMTDKSKKDSFIRTFRDLNKDFIFMHPSFNFRSTEINAVLGLNQLRRLDQNNLQRAANMELFNSLLDKTKFYTEFNLEGQSSYALLVLMQDQDLDKRDALEKRMSENGIEFRRGMSGGGNQLRQPFFVENPHLHGGDLSKFSTVDHVHNYGWYIGNYPQLSHESIKKIAAILNA